MASSIRLDTPFGMTVALASIFSGAGYRFIGPPAAEWPVDASDTASELRALVDAKADQPLPTILFVYVLRSFTLSTGAFKERRSDIQFERTPRDHGESAV